MKARAILLLVSVLGGCTVGPDYSRPSVAGAAGAWSEPATPGAVEAAWWARFDDPVLTGLIEEALSRSPDIREATARLAEARASRRAVAAGAAPRVNATGSVTENGLSKNGQLPIGAIPGFSREFSLFDAGFDASWEIDLWGRQQRKREAARARQEAAAASFADVRLMLAAEIARNYLDLRAAQADAALREESARADEDLARLAELRFRAGETSGIDLASAQAAQRSSAAAMVEPQLAARAALYRLGVLAGLTPEAIAERLQAPGAQPAGPDSISAGLRSELLERRADVRRAEQELRAATADVGVAKSDLFPRLTLIGGVGQQARDAGDLFSGGSTRFQVGPSLSWPIFSAGAIRAQVRAADARSQAAAARYEKTVLGALADSETAINRFLGTGAALRDAQAALAAQTRALGLARQRFDRGEDDRLALLRAMKARTEAARMATTARQARAQAAVALFKALGGGWEDAPVALAPAGPPR